MHLKARRNGQKSHIFLRTRMPTQFRLWLQSLSKRALCRVARVVRNLTSMRCRQLRTRLTITSRSGLCLHKECQRAIEFFHFGAFGPPQRAWNSPIQTFEPPQSAVVPSFAANSESNERPPQTFSEFVERSSVAASNAVGSAATAVVTQTQPATAGDFPIWQTRCAYRHEFAPIATKSFRCCARRIAACLC